MNLYELNAMIANFDFEIDKGIRMAWKRIRSSHTLHMEKIVDLIVSQNYGAVPCKRLILSEHLSESEDFSKIITLKGLCSGLTENPSARLRKRTSAYYGHSHNEARK